MIDYTKTIAESNNYIVLDSYTKESFVAESYQSEQDLERELIQDLENQGYEHLSGLKSAQDILANVRVQLQPSFPPELYLHRRRDAKRSVDLFVPLCQREEDAVAIYHLDPELFHRSDQILDCHVPIEIIIAHHSVDVRTEDQRQEAEEHFALHRLL